MLLNDNLRQDIIDHFEKLVVEMPLKDQKKKKESLGGLTPLQMLKHLKQGTETGNQFINQMINKAFNSSNKEMQALGLKMVPGIKDNKMLN